MQADAQTPGSKSSNPSARPAVHQGRPTCALCQRQYLEPKSACLEYQGDKDCLVVHWAEQRAKLTYDTYGERFDRMQIGQTK